MSFLDKLGSAAAVAKWKADQQMRVMRAQNSIRDAEKQVASQKSALADAALDLYNQGSLAEDSLAGICAAILQQNEQIQLLNENLAKIQAEQPPSDTPAAAAPAPQPAAPVPAPAAPAVQPAPPVQFFTPAPAPQPAALVCPECGQVLRGRFCPEHGVEGIPAPAEAG